MSMPQEAHQIYDRGYDDGYEAGYIDAIRRASAQLASTIADLSNAQASTVVRAVNRTVAELQGERVDD
jgi:flagellar biosynthesis/type III secretory pathway protein FliH